MSRSERLPDLHYFLNNGRDDVTAEEQTTLLTVLGKSMFRPESAKGQEGDLPLEVAYSVVEADRLPPGEGVSIADFGLQDYIVEIPLTSRPEPVETEPPRRPNCEGRTHSDYDPNFPDEDEYKESAEEDHPPDHGHW